MQQHACKFMRQNYRLSRYVRFAHNFCLAISEILCCYVLSAPLQHDGSKARVFSTTGCDWPRSESKRALSVGPQRAAAGAVWVERGDKYVEDYYIVCVSEYGAALFFVILLRLYLFCDRLCGVECFCAHTKQMHTTLDLNMA